MTSKRFQPFLIAMAVMWAAMLGTASAQAQNTNTTVQEGRVCINRTAQYGDSNDNATYQDCKVNINRTTQIGGNNMNQTGQFGRVNHNRTSQRQGFKRTGRKHARSNQGKREHHGSKRGKDHRRLARNHDN